MRNITEPLLAWYRRNRRELPWRQDPTPYRVWVSEIMLQQTRIEAARGYFERFMAEYSQIIYPLFLWFAFSALKHSEWTFTLIDFRSSVKLNYLDLENNGENTLAWLRRQVDKRLSHLSGANESWIREISEFASTLHDKGVRPDNVYLFMQGHTLMDNVVIVMLHAVCERLRQMTNDKIAASSRRGVVMRNELSNYNNTLRNVREILLDNENYKECFLYRKLKEDFEHYLSRIGIFPSAR